MSKHNFPLRAIDSNRPFSFLFLLWLLTAAYYGLLGSTINLKLNEAA